MVWDGLPDVACRGLLPPSAITVSFVPTMAKLCKRCGWELLPEQEADSNFESGISATPVTSARNCS
jgi:hypothetical protein